MAKKPTKKADKESKDEGAGAGEAPAGAGATAGAGAGAAAGGESGNGRNAPALHILAQYVKDLSFENPNAPQSLMQGETQPEVDISVNVNARRDETSENVFEVVIELEVQAKRDGAAVFAVELVYGGMFQLEHVPDEMLQPLVLIECPRMLFPFARQILADSIRDGGFPPLLLDPIDFAALYQQRLAEQPQAQA